MQTPATEIDQMIVQLNEFILPSSLMEKGTRPVFRIRAAEVVATRQRWVRLRQRKHQMEAFDWRVGGRSRSTSDWLVEFRTRAGSCGHSTRNSPDSRPI
jgi:hypothetical protein